MRLGWWPLVPRMALDLVLSELALERQRGDRLEAQLSALRRDGFVTSRAASVQVPPPAPEERALHRAEAVVRKRHFLAGVRDDLKARHPGYSDRQLEAAAEELWAATHAQDAPT